MEYFPRLSRQTDIWLAIYDDWVYWGGGLLDYWDPGIAPIYASNGPAPDQYTPEAPNKKYVYENIFYGKPFTYDKSKLVKYRTCLKRGEFVLEFL